MIVRWGAVLFFAMFVFAAVCFTVDEVTYGDVEKQVRAFNTLHLPHGQMGHAEIDWARWLPIYRHEVHYPLFSREFSSVNERLGKVIVTQTMWRRDVNFQMGGLGQRLPLLLPGTEGNERWETWDSLEQLPESASVQLVFSTRHFLTVEALLEMLSRYHLHLLWIPVYGGEAAGEWQAVPPFGMTVGDAASGVIQVEKGKNEFFRNVQTVSRGPLWKDHRHVWQRRMTYVEKNGFTTFGAYVQGSPQSLLRLKEVLELRAPAIIFINWGVSAW